MTKAFKILAAFFSLFLFITGMLTLLSGLIELPSIFILSSLLTPFIILGSAFMVVFWAIFQSKWLLVNLITIILHINLIGGVLQLPSVKPSKQDTTALTLCSYNIQSMLYGKTDLTATLIRNFLSDHMVDIVCFQEIDLTNPSAVEALQTLLAAYPHVALQDGLEPGFGLVIASKYPILQHANIPFEQSNNHAMWADIQLPDRTLRLFNMHLQSTQYNQIKRKSALDNWVWDSQREYNQTHSFLNKLAFNERNRLRQAQTLTEIIQKSPHASFACGDLNSSPFSFTYKQLETTLRDGFRSAGRGYEYTYRYLFNLYRTDYIFHPDSYEPLSYQSFNLPFSDHKPVLIKGRFTH